MQDKTFRRGHILPLLVFMALSAHALDAAPPHTGRHAGWKRVELDSLSFRLPPDFTRRDIRSVDSIVWRYGNGNLELTIEEGLYAAQEPAFREEPEYREVRTRIGGRRATMVFFRDIFASEPRRPYVAAAYFPNSWRRGMHLSFYATCATRHEQATAEQIFHTIEFK